MYILYVNEELRAEYSQLSHVLSVIKQLDTQHEFLKIQRPKVYRIEVTTDEGV